MPATAKRRIVPVLRTLANDRRRVQMNVGTQQLDEERHVFELRRVFKCFFFQQAATQVEMVVFRFAGDLRFAQKRIREASDSSTSCFTVSASSALRTTRNPSSLKAFRCASVSLTKSMKLISDHTAVLHLVVDGRQDRRLGKQRPHVFNGIKRMISPLFGGLIGLRSLQFRDKVLAVHQHEPRRPARVRSTLNVDVERVSLLFLQKDLAFEPPAKVVAAYRPGHET